MNLRNNTDEISPHSQKYREIKGKYLDLWRSRIFARDNYKCNVCGSNDISRLNLAHVTPVLSFVRAFSKELGLETAIMLSFREDNLITLCGTCHRIQHGTIDSTYSQIISEKKVELDNILRRDGSVKEYLKIKSEIDDLFNKARSEGHKRKLMVKKLFEEIMTERGWNNAGQLEYQNAQKSDLLSLKESFQLAKNGCRIPTGSHKLPSKEGLKCGYIASTCKGVLRNCENCNYFFCEYHFPMHIINDR
jgi:5-methylcytosine-specific restriction endonuclease McrA